MKHLFFTKSETWVSVITIIVIIAITLFNLRVAQRRARDSQRRTDIGTIADALDKYRVEFGFYPPSKEGKIASCKNNNFGEFIKTLSTPSPESKQNLIKEYYLPCGWGVDRLENIFLDGGTRFLDLIPSDPRNGQGLSYYYLSNDNFYQLYAYLEGEGKEAGFSSEIAERNILCGVQKCNFGKSSFNIPLEKSIEEYENELRRTLDAK